MDIPEFATDDIVGDATDLLDKIAEDTVMNGNTVDIKPKVISRSKIELEAIDQNSSYVDGSKYHTMAGVLAVKLKEYKNSIVEFKQAIEATKVKVYEAPAKIKADKEYLFSLFSQKKEAPKPKEVEAPFDAQKVRAEKISKLHIHLSKSYYKIKDYANTVASLDSAGEAGRNRAGLFTLRAECYWKLKEKNLALDALSRGSELFPENTTLLKQKFYYLAELKLYQAAIDASKAYMDKGETSPKEYMALAQILMNGGELISAIKVLEEAKITFSKATVIRKSIEKCRANSLECI